MKRLSKLLLINWLNFSNELISFETLNFLTGKNGSGKSTIIDALQLVVLADTRGSSFNKAANQKSDRSLESYFYGDLGDENDESRRGKKGTFTSVVAIEFIDDVKNTAFTAALIADCYKDRTFNNKWVIFEDGFSKKTFISDNGTPYTIDKLKEQMLKKFGKEERFKFFDTNKAYLEKLNYNLGNVGDKYFSLLKKGVPFSFTFTQTPDITKFITQSIICDVDNNIDVIKMQTDIRQYSELEVEAKVMSRKISALEQISKASSLITNARVTLKGYQYLIDRASFEEKKLALENSRAELSAKTNEKAQLEALITKTEQALAQLEVKIEEVSRELFSSDEKKKQEELEAKIAKELSDIEKYTQILKKARYEIKSFLSGWKTAFQDKMALHATFKKPRDITFDLDEDDYYASLKGASTYLEEVYDEILDSRSSEKINYTNLTEELSEVKQKISNIKEGVKPYPASVTEFKAILDAAGIASRLVCDSAEVVNESWRTVLEGLLDNLRFAFLVEREDYQKALQLLKESNLEETITLVDCNSISKTPLEKDSLADEITSTDKEVKEFINYLLGGIKKTFKEGLPSASVDRIVYKGAQVSKIGNAYALSPFLGRNALTLLLEKLEAEEEALSEKAEMAHRLYTFYEKLTKLKYINTDQLSDFEERLSSEYIIENCLSRKASFIKELDSIDMLYLTRLKTKLEYLKAQKKECDTTKEGYILTLGGIKSTLDTLQTATIPNLVFRIEEDRENLNLLYTPEFQASKEEEFQKRFTSNKSSFSMSDNLANVKTKKNNELNSLVEERRKSRVQYNSEFHAPFNSASEENEEFDAELLRLRDMKLPEYLDKIKEAKLRAYRQFREDFISKMKANIESVENQVDILNKALKQARFGSDRYRFTVEPNPKYESFYKMFMDPLLISLDQPTLMDDAFNSKYKEEIKALFDCLIISENSNTAEFENSIKLYTDYKTYLLFDLIVNDTITGTQQRLSKTWKKKSGGETQQPFYLALLASFSQVCRVNKQGFNNTVRLIMFDEAFSKMDGDRIKASIKLLRNFNLQAIFSAPPEKIPDISLLVDKTIIVFKDKNHSFTRPYSAKEDNNEQSE